MRKVLVFWAFIVLVLTTGASAIIYGKSLLNREKRHEEKLMLELKRQRPSLPQDAPIAVKEGRISVPEEIPVEIPAETSAEIPAEIPAEMPAIPLIPELPSISGAGDAGQAKPAPQEQ